MGKNTAHVYNLALGDGSPLYIVRNRVSGRRRAGGECKFLTEAEREKWKLLEEDQYVVESKTFKQLFEYCEIDVSEPYAIKIDYEGGERFILQQKDECLNTLKNAVRVCMELHVGLGGSKEDWIEFFREFSDTHRFFTGFFDYPRKLSDRTRNLDRKWIRPEISPEKITKGRQHIEIVRKGELPLCY